ncbi:MAG: DUF2490 domain-containing protein [Bacteroidetes bacterium]|nr:MAG: DUF2490 domain-containing protein [Bacteroidota bacterium]
MKKTALIFSLIACLGLGALGQNRPRDINQWLVVGVYTKLNKQFSLNLGQNYGFDYEPRKLKYVQTSGSIGYRLSSSLWLSAATQWTASPREEGFSHKWRFAAGISLRTRLKNWQLSNSLNVEQHTKKEKKYRLRLIYTFYLKPKSLVNLGDFKFMPFASTRLYYNIGGSPISQYNAEGKRVVKQSPDGLHRFRGTLGIYFRPTKSLKLTLYSMLQEEFNTPWDIQNHRRINVVNPRTGRVSRAFSNKLVLGISIKYYLPTLLGERKKRLARQASSQKPENYFQSIIKP